MITQEHGKKKLSRLAEPSGADTLTDSFEHDIAFRTKGRMKNDGKRINTASVMQ